MKTAQRPATGATGAPGEAIRAVRKRIGLTLSEVSRRSGLAVSTLSKLEKGSVSLSFDKLMVISKALGVDMAELLASQPQAGAPPPGAQGRRVVQRAGEGQLVETRSYRQLYLATELLHKRFTPMVVELRARTLAEFLGEFGNLIRHPGEEFVHVLEGELEFHSEVYALLRLRAGDSMYFDSEMGHAYLNPSGGACRVVVICAPRSKEDGMLDTFVSASERMTAPAPTPAPSTPGKPGASGNES